MYYKKTETEIIEATKEFATINNIHYDESTESVILNAMRELNKCFIASVSKSFNVFTMSSHNNRGYEHWARGTTMVIEKGGVKMTLNSEEIQKLVKSLPRTVGGRY